MLQTPLPPHTTAAQQLELEGYWQCPSCGTKTKDADFRPQEVKIAEHMVLCVALRDSGLLQPSTQGSFEAFYQGSSLALAETHEPSQAYDWQWVVERDDRPLDCWGAQPRKEGGSQNSSDTQTWSMRAALTANSREVYQQLSSILKHVGELLRSLMHGKAFTPRAMLPVGWLQRYVQVDTISLKHPCGL